MKLINNVFKDIREINGFNKDDILDIKKTLTKFTSDNSDRSEVDQYLESIFSSELIEYYSTYLLEIRSFIELYLIDKESSESNSKFNNFHLKSALIDEIKLISNNLLNLKLNGRNIKRFLKNDSSLDDIILSIQTIIDENNDLISNLESSLGKIESIYDDNTQIWVEINKIKNANFRINEFPNALKQWNEFNELYEFMESKISDKKKKRKKKVGFLTIYFNDFYQFYNNKQDGNIHVYSDLIFLLVQCNILVLFEGKIEDEEFVNVLDRKEINKKLKKNLRPIIRSLVEDKLKNIIKEIIELDNDFKLEDDKRKINLSILFDQKFSDYLPKLADYYFNVLEKKYQAAISDLKEYDEYKNISKFYSEKINIFVSLINELNSYIVRYGLFQSPYDEVTSSLKKIIENVLFDVSRRKEEYLNYLKEIRKERLRDSVRGYIYEKIAEVNDLMGSYQDQTSLLVREEFPQLKQLKTILSDYKLKINQVKDEVFKKLEGYKKKNINIYQIIKQWEDNFNLKRQQLSFLLGIMLNKLFKNFKELIDEEELIFDNISEITEQKDNVNSVPLNFALSNYLVDKLTETELNERISEIHLKIENLSKDIHLYQSELTNLEETLGNKVKLREGISNQNIKCGVCHKHFDFAKAQIIKCPFCEAIYHYLCVAFWLTKYNSCPSCQNVFLDPNAGMYEDQETPQ